MTVYIQTPFDNLPQEGCRAMRYWNMAEAFASRGHDVVLLNTIGELGKHVIKLSALLVLVALCPEAFAWATAGAPIPVA